MSERRPIGLCRMGPDLYLVDETGTVIDQFGPQYSEFDLPIVDGLVSPRRRRRAQASIDVGRAELAARVIAELGRNQQIAGRLSQVDVTDAHDALVLLEGDSALLHLGDDRFLERVQSYLDLSPALRERVNDIDYVDLRFDSRVYVRPAPARAAAPPGRPPARRRTKRGTSSGTHDRDEPGDSPLADEGNPMARKERYLVGLDVGTSKITAIVGEAGDEGDLDIIGIGLADSKGIRRGVVVNLEAAVESIKKAIDEAELTAGVEIDSVHLGLSGAHVKAFNSRGVVAVAGKNREITREDVRRALEAAKAVVLPSGREILHVLPQDFVVDEQDGIGAPVGMTGSRLEVNVHVVTGSASSTQNVVACVNRSGWRCSTPCSNSWRRARRC